jgi:hypothetical protein
VISEERPKRPVTLTICVVIVVLLVVISALYYFNAAKTTGQVKAAATPIPVVVSGKLEVPDSLWVIVSGIGSIALALGTFCLAWYTFDLAKETRESLKLGRAALELDRRARADESIRHQNSFLPHVALVCRDQGPEHKMVGGSVVKQRFAVELFVKNVGVGPALNIEASHMSFKGELSYNAVPASLAINEEIWAARGSGGETFEYSVTYEDVFGRRFTSKLHGALDEATRYQWDRIAAPGAT